MSGTNTYDANGTITTSAILFQTVTDVVTNDIDTPPGQTPIVSIAVDLSLLGIVNVIAENGAVADITNIAGAAGIFDVDANGGTVNLEPAGVGLLSNTGITIENGGTVTASGTFLGVLDSSAITFGSGANTLNFNSDGTLINLNIAAPIVGFVSGDTINEQDVPAADVLSYNIASDGDGNQTVTFFDGLDGAGTNLGSMTFAPDTFSGIDGTYNSGTGPLQLVAGTDGALELAVCFLRGTHIATAQGQTRVENLHIGDHVVTLKHGALVLQPITWIGNRTIIAGKQAPDEAFPVRIRAGAFSENTPRRDLLVTPEHCLFIDGKLIPARMLVNGGSILIDRSIATYSYYHIELAEHAVLLAEGLPAESYLDTGNRGNFVNAPTPSLQPDFVTNASHASWQTHAAAPLATDRATVEPIWQCLAERAAHLEPSPDQNKPALTHDPDLHLRTQSGQQIRPILAEGMTYSFLIPGGTKSLRLVSRTARPSEIMGPYMDDRRELGVLVAAIDLGIGPNRHSITTHLSTTALAGWHAPEPTSSARWTNGDATLPLDLATFHGRPAFLDITLLNAGPYRTTPTASNNKLAAVA